MEAHLVVAVEDGQAKGTRKVAVNLGETQAISVMLDDGTNLLYSGREIKFSALLAKGARNAQVPNIRILQEIAALPPD